MNLKLLGFIGIILLAGSIFAGQANAQYQGPGGQGFQGQGGQGFQVHRTPVNGTYSNSDYGIKITLPDGWNGFEMKRTSGSISVTSIPGGMQSTPGQRPPIMMTISIQPKNTTSTPQYMSQRMLQGESCTNNSASNKTVNGLNLSEVVVDCTGPMITKAKYDITQTNSAFIIVGYRANPSSNYDSQVATFDTAVGTLQIVNTPSSSSSTTAHTIPPWVKNSVKYWSQGQLNDTDFLGGLQYMVQTGIIKVPPTQVNQGTSQQIPKWIKTSANYWATGQTSEDEFIKSIQFLVSTGIIKA
jgi:hypothetical protein